MVCRIFTDDVSAAAAAVDGVAVTFCRVDDVIHAGAVDSGTALAGGCLSLCKDLGGRTWRELCRAGQRLSGIAVNAALPGWPTLNYDGRPSLSSGGSLHL